MTTTTTRTAERIERIKAAKLATEHDPVLRSDRNAALAHLRMAVDENIFGALEDDRFDESIAWCHVGNYYANITGRK